MTGPARIVAGQDHALRPQGGRPSGGRLPDGSARFVCAQLASVSWTSQEQVQSSPAAPPESVPPPPANWRPRAPRRPEEHTSQLQSPMRNQYARLRLKKTKKQTKTTTQ